MSEQKPKRFAFLRKKEPGKGGELTSETSVITPSIANGSPATEVASAGAGSLIETALGESGRRGFFGQVLSAMAAMRSPLTGGGGGHNTRKIWATVSYWSWQRCVMEKR